MPDRSTFGQVRGDCGRLLPGCHKHHMLKYLKIRYFDYSRQGAGHKVNMLGYQSPHILKVFGHKV